MNLNIMLLAIRIFQMLDILVVIYSFVSGKLNKKKSTKQDWCYLTIAKWTFYFCGIASSTLCFGIIASLEEKDIDSVCILFLIVCLVCVLIMTVQKLWRIKYNNEILVFRNSFGITKEYDINKLTIADGSRVTKIFSDGKKVIEWDTLIMNIEEDAQISKFFASRMKKR